ncbi:hypothetical protein SNE40_009626 [Patella caerulea]|uniref:THAP-type domain-containing protein n=1 Tax=Patella caerulea TaxID=87958 RepID=A0AAN8JQ16_PATCE
MVNYCRVAGCHNRSDRETQLHYYRLPKVIKNQGKECEALSGERRRLWLASLQQNFIGKNLENIRVCSAHFITGKRSGLYEKDCPGWVPSINMTASKDENTQEVVMSPEVNRFKRRQQRTEKKKDYAAVESLMLLQENQETIEGQSCDTNSNTGIETQTDLTQELISSMTSEL